MKKGTGKEDRSRKKGEHMMSGMKDGRSVVLHECKYCCMADV